MKILSMHFNSIKTQTPKKQGVSSLIYKQDFDKVSFSAKPQQINLNLEAKNVLKTSHGVLVQFQKIKEKAQFVLSDSFQMQQEAKQIQALAVEEWQEVSNLLEYGGRHKSVAVCDPNTKTDMFFETNESKTSTTMHEFKNDKLVRKVLRKPNYVAVYTYNDKKATRKIYDVKSGELRKYDSNISFTDGTAKSEQCFVFEDNNLARYSKDLHQFFEGYGASLVYNFKNNHLTEALIEPFVDENALEYSKERFLYDDESLIHYIKAPQTDVKGYKTSTEEYTLSNGDLIYSKNNKSIMGELMTADVIFKFYDSKLKRAVLNLHKEQNINMADKIFTYDIKEKPQYCYSVCCSQNNLSDFNPTDFDCNNLVWLGGKKS